jgi:hypothetical protein
MSMTETTVNIHSGMAGDVVVISGHRVGERERLGEILEPLGEPDHKHYRVRWDDGSESVFYPGSDAAIRRADTKPGRSS